MNCDIFSSVHFVSLDGHKIITSKRNPVGKKKWNVIFSVICQCFMCLLFSVWLSRFFKWQNVGVSDVVTSDVLSLVSHWCFQYENQGRKKKPQCCRSILSLKLCVMDALAHFYPFITCKMFFCPYQIFNSRNYSKSKLGRKTVPHNTESYYAFL